MTRKPKTRRVSDDLQKRAIADANAAFDKFAHELPRPRKGKDKRK